MATVTRKVSNNLQRGRSGGEDTEIEATMPFDKSQEWRGGPHLTAAHSARQDMC